MKQYNEGGIMYAKTDGICTKANEELSKKD